MSRAWLLSIALVAYGQQHLTPLDESSYAALVKSKPGKVVMVDFWATWCAPCRKEMPFLAGLAAKLKSQGLELVTVSADEPEDEKQAVDFLKASGVAGPAYVKRAKDDDGFIRSVDPKWSGALPMLILYDRRGRKTESFAGETSPATVEAAVRKILAAK